MSAERREWDSEELELLQYIKAHNTTARNKYLTKLFNEKNRRKRTEHAIRFQLKRLRRLARIAKRFGPGRTGTEPRDNTNTRDGADPRNSTYPQHRVWSPANVCSLNTAIILPRHPLLISRQLRDAIPIDGCDKLSTQHQSSLQVAFRGRSSPRHDDLDWCLELPDKLRKIVIE